MQSYLAERQRRRAARDVVRIRARRGVVLACGGHAGNPEVRSMFHPGLREPCSRRARSRLLGPRVQDASALKAGLKVGANLAGMQQNLILSLTYHVSTRLGTRDAYIPMMPGHPAFGFRGSCGISVGGAGFEEIIAVNQVGKRFFNEVRLVARTGGNRYPGGGITPGTRASSTSRRTGAIAATSGSRPPTTTTTASRRRSRSTKARRRRLLLGTDLGDLRPGRPSSARAGSCVIRMSRTTATSSKPTRSRSSPPRSKKATSSSAFR